MKIAKDKVKHFIVGFIIALLTEAVIYFRPMKPFEPYLGAFMALLGGTIWEVYDEYREDGTGFNVPDIIATALGGVLYAIIRLIVVR